MTLYATKGGWTFQGWAFFGGGRLQYVYIHEDLCLTFYIAFEYFWLLIVTFYSLGSNQISDEGASTVAAALQVNQSLQELKWVQPFMFLFFLKSVHC